MPAPDTVLLPLAVGLTLLGVILTGLAWRRGNRGRLVQGIAVALAPVALYLSGLLRLAWNAVAAVGRWATAIVLSPSVWLGLSILVLCVVLWVVGGFVARRTKKAAPAVRKGGTARGLPAAGKPTAGRSAAPAPIDDDMAEIEALLKSRGIE